MRSGLIFSVSSRFSNRYLLCRMLSTSARKMHRDGVSTSQSINHSLQALHDAERRANGQSQKDVAVAAERGRDISERPEKTADAVL